MPTAYHTAYRSSRLSRSWSVGQTALGQTWRLPTLSYKMYRRSSHTPYVSWVQIINC